MKLGFTPIDFSGKDPRTLWEERSSVSFGPTGPSWAEMSNELVKISATVSNIGLWRALENVDFGVEIKLDDCDWSVTATVSKGRFKEIEKQPFVKTIKWSATVIGPTGGVGTEKK